MVENLPRDGSCLELNVIVHHTTNGSEAALSLAPNYSALETGKNTHRLDTIVVMQILYNLPERTFSHEQLKLYLS